MPRVNIYIRNRDYKAWESIGDKPAFIHTSVINYGLQDEEAPQAVKDIAEADLAKQPEPASVYTHIVKTKSSEPNAALCKTHGTNLDDRGKCLIKGCKYS